MKRKKRGGGGTNSARAFHRHRALAIKSRPDWVISGAACAASGNRPTLICSHPPCWRRPIGKGGCWQWQPRRTRHGTLGHHRHSTCIIHPTYSYTRRVYHKSIARHNKESDPTKESRKATWRSTTNTQPGPLGNDQRKSVLQVREQSPLSAMPHRSATCTQSLEDAARTLVRDERSRQPQSLLPLPCLRRCPVAAHIRRTTGNSMAAVDMTRQSGRSK